jgi:ribosomal protein L34
MPSSPTTRNVMISRRILINTLPTLAPTNSLTAKSVPAGTKNSRPVGFYSRNSTKSTVNPNTAIPQIWPPWWCRLPLIRHGIYGSARSYAPTLFRRGRAGGWLKRII